VGLSAGKSLRHQIAAHEMHSRHDPRKTTEKARVAARARFERQVDPEGVLDPAERQRRAQHAEKAHMLRLAYLSVKARKASRG
jgi:hypothetical protein